MQAVCKTYKYLKIEVPCNKLLGIFNCQRKICVRSLTPPQAVGSEVIRKIMHSLFISLEEKSQNTFPEQADEALGSVIDNIIRNAIDHKKTDRIDITIDTQEIFCKVRIADHGIGIPDKIKKKSLKKSGMVEPAIPVWDCV